MTTTWANGPLLGFDFETTSPLPDVARIVTASTVLLKDGKITSWDWLADPGVDIPAEATEIHGITTEYAREHGQPAAEVITAVADQISRAWAHGWPVLAYNVPYDLGVLHHELTRHHDPRGLVTLTATGEPGPVIDPLVIDKHVDWYRRGSRTLTAACEHYGITLTDAHTSAADTLAAMRLAWKIAHRHPTIGAMTLPELQAAQADWYRESQHSFAGYLRDKIAQQIRADAALLAGAEQAAKIAELPDLLARADTIDAEANSWPVRTAA